MIVEGIRNGIKRGQSFRQVMISFYNAGYSRQDIEDSARAIQSQMQPPQQITSQTTATNLQSQKIQPRVSQYSPQNFSPQTQIPRQNVSSYSYQKENFFESKGLVIFLAVFLLLCLGILGVVFLFKDSLINFFNNLA